jgi:hypothetical protein
LLPTAYHDLSLIAEPSGRYPNSGQSGSVSHAAVKRRRPCNETCESASIQGLMPTKGPLNLAAFGSKLAVVGSEMAAE